MIVIIMGKGSLTFFCYFMLPSKNLGGKYLVMWWAQSAPLVKIGLTELPKSGRAPPSGVPVMEELPRKSILAPLNTVGKRQACQIQIGSLVHFKGQTKLTLTVYSTILFYFFLQYFR